ncbi:MAG: helix-turn-helix transcriptional regulator [Spirochaetaceae bacterium]
MPVRNQSYMFKLFFSFVSLVTFIVLVNSITQLFLSITEAEKIMHNAEQHKMELISYSVDYMNQSTRTLIQNMFSDNNVKFLLSTNDHDYLKVHNFFKNTKKIIASSPEVHSIYLYNSVLDNYYSTTKDFSSTSEDFFDEEINTYMNPGNTIFLKPIFRRLAGGLEVYSYILYVDVFENIKSSAIIINIKADYIKNIIGGMHSTLSLNTKIIMTNKEGYLMGPGEKLEDITFIKRILESNKKKSYFIDTYQNKKTLISYILKEDTEWFFISLTPYKSITDSFKVLKVLISLSGLLILIIGTFFSALLAKKLYLPLKVITETVSAITGKNRSGKDEFTLIKETLSDSTARAALFDSYKQKNSQTLQTELMRKLLNHTVSVSDEVIKKWDDLEIELDSEKPFHLILINIDDFYDLSYKLSFNDMNLLWFSINSRFRQDLSFDFKSLFVNMNERVSCIIVQNNSEPNNGVEVKLRKFLSLIQNKISEELGVSITITISDIGQSLLSLPKLYSETLNMAEYRLLIGQGSIIEKKDKTLQTTGYRFPIEEIHNLNKFIKNRDFINAKKSYLYIEEKLINNEPFQIRVDLIRVISSLFDTIKTLEINSILEFNLDFPQFIDDLNRLDTMGQIRSLFNNFFDNIENKFNIIKLSKVDENVEKIKKIIEHEYSDKELSTKSIADKLNMSTGYIRQLFKEFMGVSISEYIFSIRLEKSAELISMHKQSFKDAMYSVGGDNYRYFLRRFKEYFGLTPNEYLKKNNQEFVDR